MHKSKAKAHRENAERFLICVYKGMACCRAFAFAFNFIEKGTVLFFCLLFFLQEKKYGFLLTIFFLRKVQFFFAYFFLTRKK